MREMKIKASNVFYALIMGLLLVYSYSCQKDEHKVDESKAVAVLTTTGVTEIELTTAVSGGDISDDGGALVTARGVCWSTSKTPTISDSKTVDGTGSGSFISNIPDLEPSTTYHVRAYATNSNGTGYGTTYSFKTLEAAIPTLTTTEVSEITPTTAVSGGNISDDGGAAVTARGVCWSTDQSPNINDSKTTNGNGKGSFNANITNLLPNTTYYVRSYATNSEGTGYGSIFSFTTFQEDGSAGTFTDSRDGNVYKVVIIGNQVWMAENLKYLPEVVGPNNGSYTTPYYYVYGYYGTDVNAAKATANYSTYGVLYNWPAAMAGSTSSTANPSGVQGVCPAGWHLPSDAEWTQLTDYLGGTEVAGGKLKETGTTHWKSPNAAATNETDFTALPGGGRNDYYGSFSGVGRGGYWWSASQGGTNYARDRTMSYDSSYVYRSYGNNKEVGFSVRCVRD